MTGDTFKNRLAEIFNPLETLDIAEDPGAGLAFLGAVAGLVAIVLIAGGLWSAVQESLLGGDMPQSLGLK